MDRVERAGFDGVEFAGLDGDDAVTATVGRLLALADARADRGRAFAYHNHDHELRTPAETPALDTLLARGVPSNSTSAG